MKISGTTTTTALISSSFFWSLFSTTSTALLSHPPNNSYHHKKFKEINYLNQNAIYCQSSIQKTRKLQFPWNDPKTVFYSSSSTKDEIVNYVENDEEEDEIELQQREDHELSIEDMSDIEVELKDKSTMKSIYGTRGEKDKDQGKNKYFEIISHFNVPDDGFANNDIFQSLFQDDDEMIGNAKSRKKLLDLQYDNVTLPIALLSLFPEEYPSMSRARKAVRNGSILIHRGPLPIDPDTNEPYFDDDNCKRGRADDRVYPSDVIAKQVRMSGAFYPGLNYAKPPFDLPVVYEDDHFAIVNKPAGVVTYAHKQSGQPNRLSISGALPFALHPPTEGTVAILRKPAPVHRLDKPTCGLLLTAKTKPAMVDLSRQFVERKVKKTYTAIVNGIPDEPIESRITGTEARAMGVDIPLYEETNSVSQTDNWQLIDVPLDGKSAVTVWRAVQYAKSLKADQGILTMVELKPKTGRFHQLRRHMAWICERPLIGDKTYDTSSESAMHFRQKKGLYLCSNQVVLEHPFYNTKIGRKTWDEMVENHNNGTMKNESIESGVLRMSEDGNTVEVHMSIELPSKFGSLMKWEEERAIRLGDEDN